MCHIGEANKYIYPFYYYYSTAWSTHRDLNSVLNILSTLLKQSTWFAISLLHEQKSPFTWEKPLLENKINLWLSDSNNSLPYSKEHSSLFFPPNSTVTIADCITYRLMRELHFRIVVNFPQPFIKTLSFVWFSIFIFIFRVWEYILRSQKCPSEDTEKITMKKCHALNSFFKGEIRIKH